MPSHLDNQIRDKFCGLEEKEADRLTHGAASAIMDMQGGNVGTTTCILILAFILAASLLLAGWHIVAGLLHLTFAIIHAFFQWPVLLMVLGALVAVWVFFLR